MSAIDPVTPDPAVVKDDPKKPWKAYAAYLGSVLVAIASKVIADKTGLDELAVGDYLWALVLSLIPGLGTYVATNPKVVRRT